MPGIAALFALLLAREFEMDQQRRDKYEQLMLCGDDGS
jgi:hypothetical protein